MSVAAEAVFTVHAAKAHAKRAFKNVLDGNQLRAGSDHVGPNGDDYRFTLTCQP